MPLIEIIDNEIKSALKARQQLRLETLRSIKKELLEALTAKNAGGKISGADEIRILQKMVKQRKDSSNIYAAQGRADLADKEEKESEIIYGFLPEQLSEEKLEEAIKKIVETSGATSLKDMGKVIGIASTDLSGKAEGKEISAMVKKLLSQVG